MLNKMMIDIRKTHFVFVIVKHFCFFSDWANKCMMNI